MNILKQVIKIPADRSEANLLANLLTSVVENLSSGLPSFSKPTNGQGATRTRGGGGGPDLMQNYRFDPSVTSCVSLCKRTSLGFVLKSAMF